MSQMNGMPMKSVILGLIVGDALGEELTAPVSEDQRKGKTKL